MKPLRWGAALLWLIAAGALAGLAIASQKIRLALGDPSILTGGSLLVFLAALASFNLRKRLAMLPLGSATTWRDLHVVVGLLAVGVFWLHTGTLWPRGLYERALTLVFYLISANGVVGYVLQRLYPSRLTQSGVEVIYERIPRELAELREQAQACVAACTAETTSDTLAKQYLDAFEWFFRQPRFFVNHAFGGRRGASWIRYQCEAVRRYLNPEECRYLDRIARLAELKNKIDFHYAAQALLKGWLLVHVPLAAALLVLVAWHVALVTIYAR